jgi:hypothetical protein
MTAHHPISSLRNTARATASVGEGGYRRWSDLDPAGRDERLHIGRVETNMPADLDVRDSPFRDQPTDEPHRGAQPLGGLLDR